jgi:splicing suppressor protein 51
MDTIYDGESAESRKAFKRYLRKAERKIGYLPDWWNEEKSKECIRFGLRKSEWSYLGAAVEKSDITEHYDSPLMPMQLRMFAEEVIGEPLGGMGGGASMRAMQMMAEGGTGGLNMSTLSLR